VSDAHVLIVLACTSGIRSPTRFDRLIADDIGHGKRMPFWASNSAKTIGIERFDAWTSILFPKSSNAKGRKPPRRAVPPPAGAGTPSS
jgi:hypothetical protein